MRFRLVFFCFFIKKNYSRKVSLRSGATGCEVPKATVSPGAPEARGRPRSAPQGERGKKDTEEIYRAERTQETALAPLAREKPATSTMSSKEIKYFEQKVQVTIHIEQNLVKNFSQTEIPFAFY